MSTFIWIMTYATVVLTLLVGLSFAFIGLARWMIGKTYDPDAEAH